LLGILAGYGFRRNPHVTATYEVANITPIDLAAAMADFWVAIQEVQNATSTHVDHVWMYSDNPPRKITLRPKK
jgi:hypothetical protein